MENQDFKRWSIDICENINEPIEIIEEDGEKLALLKRGTRRYGQPIEDNSIRPAASLTNEELENLKQNLAPENLKTILDISQEFRKTADKIYDNFGLPFGYKGYIYKNECLGKIEFFTDIEVKNVDVKNYNPIYAHNVVKLLNYPKSSPLHLAAELHELAFEIEYYANLEPTPFVQRALIEIGIKAGKLERDINDELTPHFDAKDMKKGEGFTTKQLFETGLETKRFLSGTGYLGTQTKQAHGMERKQKIIKVANSISNRRFADSWEFACAVTKEVPEIIKWKKDLISKRTRNKSASPIKEAQEFIFRIIEEENISANYRN